MITLNAPYTVGLWTVRPGNEKAFIVEWTAFAKWTAENQAGSGTGYLLQDPLNPQQFISYGPWENTAAIDAWRNRPEFKAFAAKAKELCEVFQPRSLVLVAASE